MLSGLIHYWHRYWGWRIWYIPGPWVYYFNNYTGERLAVCVRATNQPADREWLKAGTSYTIIGG